jgi:phenylacetate-CoA ligase
MERNARGVVAVLSPPFEAADRRKLAALQQERLQVTVGRTWAVPFYRERLQAARLTPGAPVWPDELTRLPLTTKEDLREQYPHGLLAVEVGQVARFHATSGTKGRPVLVAYTANDLAQWAELCARLLTAAGVRPGEMIHNALGYGLFTGGLGLHAGAERLGCAVVPASGGGSLRQIQLMQDLRPAAVKSTPSYILHLADVAEEAGIDPGSIGLRSAILGAEPWSEALRRQIEQRWRLTAFDSYGLSEMFGPGVAFECRERAGLHLQEDHFLAEVIDPATGERLPDGAEGELVLTSLTKEAMPLLRYRTGDRTALTTEPCHCGRTGARLRRVRGRTDEMLVVRGVNLFPSEVERVLTGFDRLRPHYELELGRSGSLDRLTVRAEMRSGLAPDPALAEQVRRRLKEELGLTAAVELVDALALGRREGTKALRVIDRRKE